MLTESEIRTRLTKKAGEDDAFRALLLADPRTAVEQEFGATVPDGFSVHVHEETATSAHLVLPPAGGRLTPAELGAVAGGNWDAQMDNW